MGSVGMAVFGGLGEGFSGFDFDVFGWGRVGWWERHQSQPKATRSARQVRTDLFQDTKTYNNRQVGAKTNLSNQGGSQS